jgi:tetratricopeptide (TPR) repeat protein
MNGNFLTRRSIALSPIIALALLAGATIPVAAQASRFAVLVPTFANKQGGRENFGKDTAEELQKLIDEMATHESVDRGELRDALRKYGVKEEVLNDDGCIPARQLASLIAVELVLCGQFTEVGEKNFTVDVNVIAPAASEVYELESFSATNPKEAAQKLATQFEGFIEGLRWAVFCSQDTEQEAWQEALEKCTRALEITPNSEAALYSKAYAQWKLGSLDEAKAGFERVIEIDAANDDAMLALGLVVSEMGDKEGGLKWFREYLNLNPGNIEVRLSLATDAARAGNPEGALAILEEGMTDGDAPDPQLAEYAGLFAMNAASTLSNSGQTEQARPFLDKAIRYLEPVVQAKDTIDANLYRNLMTAYRLTEQNEKAATIGQQAVEAHPQDAALWSAFADVLNGAGRRDEAMTALDRVAQIDPSYAVNARKASWMVDAGNIQAALTAANAAAASNEMTDEQLDVVAQKIIVAGYELAKAKNYQEAIQYYEAAEPLARTDRTTGMKAFFHAFALFQPAFERANRQTLADAQATLPIFQRVLTMLNAAQPYCASNPSSQQNCGSIRQGATEQIEIQELIIRRGR